MGILPIRELARILARDPTGDSGLTSPRLTGPRIKSTARAKARAASLLLFASARRTRALCSSRGPMALRRQRAIRPRRGAREGSRAFRCCTGMCNQRNPAADADPLGRTPNGRKALGRVSLVPFFARAKKGTRSPQASGSLCSKTKQQELDSRLRGNDERNELDESSPYLPRLSVFCTNAAALSCSAFSAGRCAYTMCPDS